MADRRTVRRETTEQGTTPGGVRVTKETVTETKTAPPVLTPTSGGTTNVNVKTGKTDAASTSRSTVETGGSVSINTPEGTQVNVNT